MKVTRSLQNYKDKCTIIVSSCDRYQESWLPFFSLLQKKWPECPFERLLITESKQCDIPGVRTVNTGDCAWTERINKALATVKTPTVLFFLEDFFLQAPVHSDEFVLYLDALLNDPSIAVFYFNCIGGFRQPSEQFPDFYDMSKTELTTYHLNCQVGLWNTKVFYEVTKEKMSPWEFETEGFDKVSPEVRNMKFFCSKHTVHSRITDKDIFSYLLERQTGYGIWKSMWLWNNKKLFKKEGIQCSCSTLPTLTWFDYHTEKLMERIKSNLSQLLFWRK